MFMLCAKHEAYWPEKLVDHKAHFFLKIGIDCKFALISGNPKGRLGFFFSLYYITEYVFCRYFLDVLTFCSVFIWLNELGRFGIAVYTWPELLTFRT